MYYYSQGVPQNYKEAVKWIRKAIENGNAEAMGMLGLMHAEGHGVIQSDTVAHMWLNLASAHGDEKAAKLRDQLAKVMTKEEVSTAQSLAFEWMEKNGESLLSK